MYTITDRDEILRLMKVGNADQNDINSIFHLYKKYINPNQQSYVMSCNCHHSIGALYEKLRDFYSQNGSKFINE